MPLQPVPSGRTDPATTAPPVHRVAVLALPGVYPFELSIPGRIFGATDGLYRTRTFSVDGEPVRTNADYTIAVDHGPGLLRTADTVIVPPAATGLVSRDGELDPTVAGVLRRIRPGTRIVSICIASFYLAALGVLDGRPATTHWHAAEGFSRMFPRVRLDPDVLFVDDGDILTSAGAASGLDLCLHLVRRDHGSAAANRAARTCVVPPWREGGQAQYIERPVPEALDNGTATTRDWALGRLGLPLTVDDLASHAHMSLRTFNRRFLAETGMSPGRWLTVQRVARAQHLLEATDLSIDRIAGEVGFATPTSLRQHMNTLLGVSPVAYRRTFRAGVSAP